MNARKVVVGPNVLKMGAGRYGGLCLDLFVP